MNGAGTRPTLATLADAGPRHVLRGDPGPTAARAPYPRAHSHTSLLARAEQLIYSWTEGAATQSPDPVQ